MTEVTGNQNVEYSACREPPLEDCINGNALPVIYTKNVGNIVDDHTSVWATVWG